MAKKDEIIVYTNGTCGYCQQVKEMLNKEEIEFTIEHKNKQYGI